MVKPSKIDTTDPKQTGAIGGRARAKAMTKAERSAASSKAVIARWAKAREEAKRHPKATHVGVLPIGDMEIGCAVLDNGRRVINERAFQKALGRSSAGGQTYRRRAEETVADPLPIYVALKSLKPFTPHDFSVPTYQYVLPGGGLALGVDAISIPAICSIWLAARRSNALQAQQLPTAEKAEIIMNGLATVGIIALVDEATGYQAERASNALAELLEQYIGKSLARWSEAFGPDFYKHMFRLRGWTTDWFAQHKPPLIGVLTNNVVYQRLAPIVLKELERKNPRVLNGQQKMRRKNKHHQWLSSAHGHPRLREHIAKVVTVMQLSSTWEEFIEKLDHVAPKCNDTPYLLTYDQMMPKLLAADKKREQLALPVPATADDDPNAQGEANAKLVHQRLDALDRGLESAKHEPRA